MSEYTITLSADGQGRRPHGYWYGELELSGFATKGTAEELGRVVADALAGHMGTDVVAEIRSGDEMLWGYRADGRPSAPDWDPSSPQHAIIRAAIAWRVSRGAFIADDPERRGTPEDLALIEAVDELPHIGETADV